MPHNEILHNYIKRTHATKGKDFENFITLALLFKKYKDLINRTYRKLRGLEADKRKLESEVSRLKTELEQSDRIINNLEEINETLKQSIEI